MWQGKKNLESSDAFELDFGVVESAAEEADVERRGGLPLPSKITTHGIIYRSGL